MTDDKMVCHPKRRLACFQMLACFEAWESEAPVQCEAIEEDCAVVVAKSPCEPLVDAAVDASRNFEIQCDAVQAAKPKRHPPHKYKTELCTNFGAAGTCRYGSKCVFAHGGCDKR